MLGNVVYPLKFPRCWKKQEGWVSKGLWYFAENGGVIDYEMVFGFLLL